MKKAAVIGTPIAHSRSPAIFSFLSEKLQKNDFQYSATEVPSAELKGFLKNLKSDAEFLGVNVTLPHKEAVLPLLDSVSEEVALVQAVNVIQKKGSSLQGWNTDVIGVLKTLRAKFPQGLHGQDVWIWGAGGAARAVLYSVGQMGARRVFVENQTLERAEKICADFSIRFVETRFFPVRGQDEVQEARPILLVNTTPLGMKGVPLPEKGIPFAHLAQLKVMEGAWAFDLIYIPLETVFMRLAQEKGIQAVSGLDLLIDQALATWEIWWGEEVSRTSVREELSSHLIQLITKEQRPSAPIFLTGFMGSGKTTVGRVLAERLGWKFVDTDQWVEKETGLKVSEIFRLQGEVFFREWEKKAVICACSLQNTVVSLGGGALAQKGIRDQIRSAGRLVYLSADVDTLQDRLQNSASQRPLLAGLSPADQRAKIEALLLVRKESYASADFEVPIAEGNARKIADQIMTQMRESQ